MENIYPLFICCSSNDIDNIGIYKTISKDNWEFDELNSSIKTRFEHEDSDAASAATTTTISAQRVGEMGGGYDLSTIFGIPRCEKIYNFIFFTANNKIGLLGENNKLFVFDQMSLELTSPVYFGTFKFLSHLWCFELRSEGGAFTRLSNDIKASNRNEDLSFWSFANLIRVENEEKKFPIFYFCQVCNILKLSQSIKQTVCPTNNFSSPDQILKKPVSSTILDVRRRSSSGFGIGGGGGGGGDGGDFIFHDGKIKLKFNSVKKVTTKNLTAEYYLISNPCISYYCNGGGKGGDNKRKQQPPPLPKLNDMLFNNNYERDGKEIVSTDIISYNDKNNRNKLLLTFKNEGEEKEWGGEEKKKKKKENTANANLEIAKTFLDEVEKLLSDESVDAKLVLRDINMYDKISQIIELALIYPHESVLWSILNFFFRENLWHSKNAARCINLIIDKALINASPFLPKKTKTIIEENNNNNNFPSVHSGLFFFSKAFVSAYENKGICKNFNDSKKFWFYAEPNRKPIQFKSKIVQNLLNPDDLAFKGTNKSFSFWDNKNRVEKIMSSEISNSDTSSSSSSSFFAAASPKILKITLSVFNEIDFYVINDRDPTIKRHLLGRNHHHHSSYSSNNNTVNHRLLESHHAFAERPPSSSSKIMVMGLYPPPEDVACVAALKRKGFYNPKLIDDGGDGKEKATTDANTTSSSILGVIDRKREIERMMEKSQLIKYFSNYNSNKNNNNAWWNALASLPESAISHSSVFRSVLYPFVTKSISKYCSEKSPYEIFFNVFLNFFNAGDGSAITFLVDRDLKAFYNNEIKASPNNNIMPQLVAFSKNKTEKNINIPSMQDLLVNVFPEIIFDIVKIYYPIYSEEKILKPLRQILKILCKGCAEAFSNAINPKRLLSDLRTMKKNPLKEEDDDDYDYDDDGDDDDDEEEYNTMGYLKRELNSIISINAVEAKYRELLRENERLPEKLNLKNKYNKNNSDNNSVNVNNISNNSEIPGKINYEDFSSLLKLVNISLYEEIKSFEKSEKERDSINDFVSYKMLIDELLRKPNAANAMEMDDITQMDITRDMSYLKNKRVSIKKLIKNRKIYSNFEKLSLYFVFDSISDTCFLMVPNVWKDISFHNLVNLIFFLFDIIEKQIFNNQFNEANNLLNKKMDTISKLLKLNHCDNVMQKMISNGITADDVRRSADMSPSSFLNLIVNRVGRSYDKNLSPDMYHDDENGVNKWSSKEDEEEGKGEGEHQLLGEKLFLIKREDYEVNFPTMGRNENSQRRNPLFINSVE